MEFPPYLLAHRRFRVGANESQLFDVAPIGVHHEDLLGFGCFGSQSREVDVLPVSRPRRRSAAPWTSTVWFGREVELVVSVSVHNGYRRVAGARAQEGDLLAVRGPRSHLVERRRGSESELDWIAPVEVN